MGRYSLRRIGGVVLAAAAVGLGVGVWQGGVVGGGGGGAGNLANVFVGANGSCVRSSTPVAYNPATSCNTFNGAYVSAIVGDTVNVENGTYAGQTFAAAGTKGSGACDGYTIGAALSGCVTFQPDAGATVAFTGGITVNASYIQLKNFDLSSPTLDGGLSYTVGCAAAVSNIVMTNVSAQSAYVYQVSNMGILGGSYGNEDTGTIMQVRGGDCGGSPTHIRIDGVTFHDAIQCVKGSGGCADPHLECFQSASVDYLTIRNSVFKDCAQGDIQDGGNGVQSHHLIEQNLLAPVCVPQPPQNATCVGVAALQIACIGASSFHDYTVRFNAINGYISQSNSGSCTGANAWSGTNLLVGNVSSNPMSGFRCGTEWFGWTIDYNVWTAASSAGCGTHDHLADGQLVDPTPTAYNFHLTNCSVIAANLVPTTVTGGYPTTDIAGATRPDEADGLVDAGAYETC